MLTQTVPAPLTAIRSAESDLIATIRATADALDSIGSNNLTDALLHLREAKQNAMDRLAEARSCIGLLLGDLLAEVQQMTQALAGDLQPKAHEGAASSLSSLAYEAERANHDWTPAEPALADTDEVLTVPEMAAAVDRLRRPAPREQVLAALEREQTRANPALAAIDAGKALEDVANNLFGVPSPSPAEEASEDKDMGDAANAATSDAANDLFSHALSPEEEAAEFAARHQPQPAPSGNGKPARKGKKR